MLIKSGNQVLAVQADQALLDAIAESDFLYRYIPEVEVQGKLASEAGAATFQLAIERTDATRLVREGNNFTFTYLESAPVSTEDVITVIDYCLDYIRALAGTYCLHGSAVARDGAAYIFFGGISGLGKTTLTLALCERYGFSFIGDEKLLITDTMMVRGGTKALYFNKPGLFKSSRLALHNKSKEELATLLPLQSEPVKLGYMIQPIVMPSAKLETETWDKSKANYHIYEELTRKIRGTTRRVANATIPLPSLDTDELALARSAFAHKLSETLSFLTVKGDVRKVAKAIQRLQ